jgi:hypothetical protein
VSNPTGGYGKVVTVLRGDVLRDARGTVSAPTQSGFGTSSGDSPKTSSASNSATSIYGVPVSAVQHCCGRGCKHCPIYWHRMKP